MKRNFFGEIIFDFEDAPNVPDHIDADAIDAAEISLMNKDDPSEGWAIELRDEDGETLAHAHNIKSKDGARLFCARAGIEVSKVEVLDY